MRTWSVVLDSTAETEELGSLLGQEVRRPATIWLCGELGAGKTCLTRGLARGLEVAEDEPVTSPSYTLMNHYHGRLELYHFDLYRLGQVEDLDDLGFDEHLHGNGVTVVEWADRFPERVGGGLRIDMVHHEIDRRAARLQALDEQGVELLRRLVRRWQERGTEA